MGEVAREAPAQAELRPTSAGAFPGGLARQRHPGRFWLGLFIERAVPLGECRMLVLATWRRA
jgi:hypothetical protein